MKNLRCSRRAPVEGRERVNGVADVAITDEGQGACQYCDVRPAVKLVNGQWNACGLCAAAVVDEAGLTKAMEQPGARVMTIAADDEEYVLVEVLVGGHQSIGLVPRDRMAVLETAIDRLVYGGSVATGG